MNDYTDLTSQFRSTYYFSVNLKAAVIDIPIFLCVHLAILSHGDLKKWGQIKFMRFKEAFKGLVCS